MIGYISERGDGVVASSESGNQSAAQASSDSDTSVVFPASGWISVQKARLKRPDISVQTILSFFLNTRCKDGESMANFKAVVGDSKLIRLYEKGYV